MIKKLENLKEQNRLTKPLIHCITNPISIHDCANIVLASGARPIMAEHPLEVAEITSTAQVLALNLGNITDARMEAMPIALKTAVQKEIPVLLDLVGTACSTLRKNFAKELLEIHVPSVLKGNMSELLAMIEEESHAVGIDAGEKDSITDENRNRLTKLFQKKADEWNTVFLITGKEDMIVSKDECFFVQNGSPAMANITGTGCMLGMFCASYLASASNAFNAALTSTVEFGIAGELAAKKTTAPGSFQVQLLDSFYQLTEAKRDSLAKIIVY